MHCNKKGVACATKMHWRTAMMKKSTTPLDAHKKAAEVRNLLPKK
jgi:hypothetical protein